ncbi:MAG TPA: CHAT domain-containing tetratricopeptide repeat protein [Thermoanaerobaculia bacterium]
MNSCRIALFVALFFCSAPMLAQSDPLAGLGQLVISGRSQEARTRLLEARERYIAQKNASGEAAIWLLLGMTDITAHDAEGARRNLMEAEARFTAGGDHFGAWMTLWMASELDKLEGRHDDAIVLHERARKLLREAADPTSRFSIESFMVLGSVFGAPTDSLAPFAQYPQVIKPVFLKFAGITGDVAYANVLVEAGGDLDKADALLASAAREAPLFGGFFDFQIASCLGDLRRQQWRLDETRESYLKALNASKVLQGMVKSGPILELELLAKLAELELLSGRTDEALAWNDRALALVRAAGDAKQETSLLHARADLLQKGGRSDEALALYEQSLKVAKANGNVKRQAMLNADMGTLYMFKGAYGRAVKHLEDAIGLYQSLNEPLLESTVWTILAEVHLLLDVDDSAALALENAHALAKKSGYKLAEKTIELVSSLRGPNRATAEAALKTWSELPEAKTLMLGEDMQELLRETLRSTRGEPVTRVPKVGAHLPAVTRWMPLFLRGKMELERGDYVAARQTLTEALAADPGGDLRAGVLAAIGATHWRTGNRDEAIRFFQDGAKALEASAGDVKVEELLTGYLGSERRVYFEVLVEILARSSRSDEALAQAERARARAFLQLIGNHRFNAERGADPHVVREAEILRTEIIDRERALKGAAGEQAKKLAADVGRARERYRTVMTRVKVTNPEYAALTTVEPLDVAAIRKEIPEEATMINYFVTPYGVHVWVIDRNETHYATLPVDKTALHRIVCWADQFGPRQDARGVALPNTCGDAATADEVFEKLFAPIAKTIKTRQLVLVPHGVLHYVPFAALQDRKTGRYLIDDYVLTYAPSASALRFLRAKETPVDGTALILGNPASPLPALQKLPWAEQEATAIARTLGARPQLGVNAREALLYGLGGKIDLVHLAAHGMYDAANPLFSRIALAAGDSHDGSLTVHEILSSVDLTGVNLVVLSACRTAVGARSGGDEVVGLTRALLYAGTPGVLSTLWNIDDAASAGLMEEFYRRLAGGSPAAEALREAQLAIKKSECFSDPRYWAAFTLHGQPQGLWKNGAE